MQIWYIKDGEKTGPLEIYEIRSLIREDKVHRDTRVWHEGCPGWIPADEVHVLEGEFLIDDDKSEDPPFLPEEAAADEEEKKRHERPPFTPWRRLGARWFDANVYLLLFGLGALLSTGKLPGLDMSENSWYLVLQALPWLLIEGALVHLWGKTPGKWLLGLEVERLDASPLPLGSSVMRAIRVWILGMGMGILPLTIIGHIAGYFIGKKRGAPLWDLASGFQVTHRPLSRQRVALFVLLYLIVNSLLAWLMWPVFQEVMAETKK